MMYIFMYRKKVIHKIIDLEQLRRIFELDEEWLFFSSKL